MFKYEAVLLLNINVSIPRRIFPAKIRLDEVIRTFYIFVFRRRLDQDEYFHLTHTSSRCPQDILIKTNIFVLVIRLQDVFKTFSRFLQDVFKTCWQDVFKTSCKNVFKTFSRRLEDVLKTFWRSLEDIFLERCLQGLLKTFSKRFQYVWSI